MEDGSGNGARAGRGERLIRRRQKFSLVRSQVSAEGGCPDSCTALHDHVSRGVTGESGRCFGATSSCRISAGFLSGWCCLKEHASLDRGFVGAFMKESPSRGRQVRFLTMR